MSSKANTYIKQFPCYVFMIVAQLADKIGVTTRYIYQIEAGEREPRTELVIWIIAALGMEMEDILELTEEEVDG